MTLRTSRSLALLTFTGLAIICAPAVATAQSYAPLSPAGYANSVIAPALRDDDAVSSAVESPRLRRQVVDYATREAPGTIVIDTPNTYLYLVLGGGKALRYGIGVGRDGFTWSGVETISRTAEWPDWYPPAEMIARQPYLPRFVAGGPGNPLGARALYLGNSQYRIHGTNDPSTIGHRVSSGCIRLTNADITDLFGRVKVGTKVVVLPQTARHAPPSAPRTTRAPTTSAPIAYAPVAPSPAPVIAPLATTSTRSTSGFAFGLH
jgi:lipoprotein-anchoring transpeptidase ErfK/SrfK